MCAVPAQAAGVGRIAVVTPPEGAPLVARAAQLLGLCEVWAVGRPQAIAALAYGTETIAPVDKIVGPGNAFVNEAKALVSRDVAVDLPAGPSEVVVLASAGADLEVAELELAAQREHGPDAVCRLVEANGDLEGALARVEALAPEHLVLLGEEAERLAPRVRNAGAVFVGRWSPVAAGDYATGGNHVLPTGGRARAVGGLGLETFLKPVTVQRLTPEGLARVRPVVEALAELEGMPAHAEAVRR
jgi:histidinol dehydrogenase